MPVPLLGIAIAQIGLRAIPVLLRTGQMAIRYMVTTPGNKGKVLKNVVQRTVGKDSVIDDVGALTAKVKGNPVSKVLDVKTLTSAERNTLMQTTYKDTSKILRGQKSYPTNAKLAKDIETGFNQKFDPRFAKESFIAGDKAAIVTGEAIKQTTQKLATAPKALPKPTAVQMQKLNLAEAGKVATETAKAQITSGMGVTKEVLKQVPKDSPARTQIAKLYRAKKKADTAAKGTKSGPVITEGLKGVGKNPKPAWWQGSIPSWLRVEGQAYKGAYPGRVSGERVLGFGAGAAFTGSLGKGIHEAILESQMAETGPVELTTAEILAQQAEEYKNSYNANATIDSSNVILPSQIEQIE